MKIGVLSDTHDDLRSTKRALEVFLKRKVDLIVHCGDWVAPFAVEFISRNSGDIPVKGVPGNNEGDIRAIVLRNQKLDKPVQMAERRVLAVELPDGGQVAAYHGDDELILEALIGCGKYKAVFTGHTHAVRNEKVGEVLVLNPGAVCYARNGEIKDEATVAVYDSDANSAEIVTLDQS